MTIINKIDDEGYIQWIVKFVEDVLRHAQINADEVVIEDIEPDKRIFISLSGCDYDIRTWDFQIVDKDSDNNPCSEIVRYTLFKEVTDFEGSHSEEVDFGTIIIRWENK